MAINLSAFGRNIDEIVRLVDACQHADTHGEVCLSDGSMGGRPCKSMIIDEAISGSSIYWKKSSIDMVGLSYG